jgi:carbamoyl-phosphate synthase large subunit
MTSIERKKVIMVLGAGQYQTDVIKKLRASGFYVVALDRDGSAVGFSEADKGLAVDISDKEAVFECAAKVCPDGIMPMNDFGTRAAFYACQRLGLIGPSYYPVFAVTIKELCARSGLTKICLSLTLK